MILANKNNNQFLREALTGSNDQLFSHLYKLNREKVFNLAYKILGCKIEAEDLTQEIFIATWLRWKNLQNINIDGYLMITARNRSINESKRMNRMGNNHRNYKTFISGNHHFDYGADHVVYSKELSSLLEDAVDRLAPGQRKIYELIVEQGHHYKKVAELLEIAQTTVHQQRRNALKSIRTYIDRVMNIGLIGNCDSEMIRA